MFIFFTASNNAVFRVLCLGPLPACHTANQGKISLTSHHCVFLIIRQNKRSTEESIDDSAIFYESAGSIYGFIMS